MIKTGNVYIVFEKLLLLKVMHAEENIRLRTSTRNREAAFHCKVRWKYANILCNSQSRVRVETYAKKRS